MRVAFRADASPVIGTGHFMRCLALADGLRERGACIRFVSRHLPSNLCRMLDTRSYELAIAHTADADATIDALSTSGWDWLVVDHYALDALWETAVRGVATRILAIDDLANRPHDCDVLVDQNLFADMEKRYVGKVPRGCQLLIGPRYALLRDEFRRQRDHAKPRTGLVTRVLVFFGGIDAGNYTSLALQALVNCHAIDWHVDVAIGAEHPNRKQLEAECQRHGFACHVDTNQMAELMAAADLMIGAGGTASWERCCVGLPALAFSVADNQRRVVEHAALHGLVYAPGRGPITASSIELHLKALVDNPRLLEMLSRNGLRAVDGLGVNRVVRALDYDSIVMREATLDDADALFAWRNHDSIRSVSRQTHPIAWPEHHAWLTDVLGNPNRTLLIGERNGEPIGVVRFDVTQGEAEASIYLVPARAGSGLGSRLLLAGESWLLAQRRDVTFFRAEVFEGNDRSHRLFQSTGYLGESTVYRKRVPPS